MHKIRNYIIFAMGGGVFKKTKYYYIIDINYKKISVFLTDKFSYSFYFLGV